jgi:peptidoglycan/LPS O-acetylase OafA/YrhL
MLSTTLFYEAHLKSFTSARLPGLDTLRAIAIVAVILFHLGWLLPESFGPVSRFGWMGVDLFFVLSGYLIGSQLLKPYLAGEKPSLADFYRRRIYRILPAYLFVLSLYALLPVWREADGMSPLWQFLTFTENLFVDYSTHQAFSHVWSLCVEEHFYLILPLLVLSMMRRPSLRKTATLLVSAVLLGIALRAYVLFHELQPLGADNAGVKYIEHIYYPTYTHLDGLLAGVTLALIKIFRPAWWAAVAQRGHSTLLASLLLIGTSVWLFKDRFDSVTGISAWGTVIGFPILSLGLGLLVASSISRNGLLSRSPIPGAKLLATLAFSLYLIHKEIVHLDRIYLPSLTKGRDATATLTYGASCIAAAGLLYLCIERPFMLLRDRQEDRRQPITVEDEMRSEPAL